jgi:hypothetical protein
MFNTTETLSGRIKMHYSIKGESQSVKHKNNQPHILKDSTELI